ncbi:MAG: glycosyltransferase, partial [Actinobacteria bacterium]|nr:glycosyltransferase [Actinomycetota bacterium]
MRILIPLFFNAPMGGLHHHVLASVRAMVAAGHEVAVMSKPGPFADEVRGLGAAPIETNWEDSDLARDVAAACASAPDVVYCHPFASRQLGVAVAEALAVPLAAVWHGMYDDFVEQWADSVDCAIAVSEGVAAHLRNRCPELSDRLLVIANGVDEAWRRQPQPPHSDGTTHIGFVCRLDEDKQFILDVFAAAVVDESLAGRDDVVWHVIGDGEGRGALAAAITDGGVQADVRWHGWLDTAEMMKAMAQCDIVIAPG